MTKKRLFYMQLFLGTKQSWPKVKLFKNNKQCQDTLILFLTLSSVPFHSNPYYSHNLKWLLGLLAFSPYLRLP